MIAKYDEKAQPTSWSERGKLRQAEEVAAHEVPKPYTVPEGYKAPTMSEQWLYATRRHPYYRHVIDQSYVTSRDFAVLLCCGETGILAMCHYSQWHAKALLLYNSPALCCLHSVVF